MRPVCRVCNTEEVRLRGLLANGEIRYGTRCNLCEKRRLKSAKEYKAWIASAPDGGVRPVCIVCGRNPGEKKGRRVDGSVKYGLECGSCRKRRRKGSSGPCVPTEIHNLSQKIEAKERELALVCDKLECAKAELKEARAETAAHKRTKRRREERLKARRARLERGLPGKYGIDAKRKASKKSHCERCGFIAQHPSQLDVDHIDGNSLNNDPSNWQTLCANCHRWKTMKEGDHLTPRQRPDGSSHATGEDLGSRPPVQLTLTGNPDGYLH